MYYVYILQSKVDNTLYTGFTTNIKRRLLKHNRGENISTKNKIPYKLIFFEAFLNKKDALNREKYLKSGYGKRSIKKLLKKYFSLKGKN